MANRIRVFLGCSLDGFIAGPHDELDWLTPAEDTEDTFSPFLAEVGALLMGRRTYEVVSGFSGPWPYGETPVLVATHRPLQPKVPTVRPVQGTIRQMVEEAKQVAGPKDVYLDGGQLFQSALTERLVDELTVTLVPLILGGGLPLFAASGQRHPLTLVRQRPIGGGLVQLTYRLQAGPQP